MIDSTSESLLLRLQSGNNPDDWSKFTKLYTPLIFYWSRKSGLSPDDAADLCQEVMTLVFQKLPDFQYDRQRSFRGWLRTVTLNKFRERLRKKSIRTIEVTDSVLSNVPAVGQRDAAQNSWDQDYAAHLISGALDMVKPDFEPATWVALKSMFSNPGKSVAEIATETGVSRWTIYSARSRLMKRLRNELAGLLD